MLDLHRYLNLVYALLVDKTRRPDSSLLETIEAIDRAYRLLMRSKLNTSQALEKMRAELNGSADVAELIAFIESSQRGLTK